MGSSNYRRLHLDLVPGRPDDDLILRFYESLPTNGRGREGITRHMRLALIRYIESLGLPTEQDDALSSDPSNNHQSLSPGLVSFPDEF